MYPLGCLFGLGFDTATEVALLVLAGAGAAGGGGIELLAVLAGELGMTGGVWDVVTGIDLNAIGYLVVGLFVIAWAVAIAVWRLGRIEERWSAELR